jgi:N-acetylglucosaminyl-diphospho-decaprenol L-rhamnosyltransferase
MDSFLVKPIPEISISIVSHAQAHLIKTLLADIDRQCSTIRLEILVTLNLEEPLSFLVDSFSFPIKIIRNKSPLGFAANHNQAFACSTGQFFCVMNPDIRLNEEPFPELLSRLQDSTIGLAAPLVVNNSGEVEDSARVFPTPFKIICKAFGGCKGSDYLIKNEPIYPDWVGGMFMLFPREVFEKLSGFNERFYLYYEDVDLCARLRLQGYQVVLCSTTKVIHEAQRSSHKSLRYLSWHIASMLRFFCSSVFFKIIWKKFIRANAK